MAASAGENPGLARLINKWQQREIERDRQAAIKAQEVAESTDPRESAVSFIRQFEGQKDAVVRAIQRIPAVPSAAVEAKEGLAQLNQNLAAVAYWLPQYELRRLTNEVQSVARQLGSATEEAKPRRRFAFSGAPTATVAVPSTECEAPVMEGSRIMPSAAAPSSGVQTSAPLAPTSNHAPQHDHASAAPEALSLRDADGQSLEIKTEGRDVSLSALHGCTVTINGSPAALYVDNLRGCTVTAGPVLGACLIEGVENCVFRLAAQQVRIHNTHETEFRLRVRSPPIIEHSSGCRFGPLQHASSELQERLNAQGLGGDNGAWSKVQDFGWVKTTPSPNWAALGS